jgi:hypothetical protein
MVLAQESLRLLRVAGDLPLSAIGLLRFGFLCREKQHDNYNESYWSHRCPDMVPPLAGRDKSNFGSAKTTA